MYDIATDHAGGLTAAFLLLLVVFAFGRGLRFLAGRRVAWAVRVTQAYDAAPSIIKLAAALMLLSGGIHLALVPGHEGITGVLFVIDGLGFIGFAIAAFVTTWWRRPAALWLVATILAYLVWVIAGWETPDQVGIACKLIELVALGLLMRLAGDRLSADGVRHDAGHLGRRAGPSRCPARTRRCPAATCGRRRHAGAAGGRRATPGRYPGQHRPLPGSGRGDRRRVQAGPGIECRTTSAFREFGQCRRRPRPQAAASARLRADAAGVATDRRHVPDEARRPMGSRPRRAVNAVASARGHLLLPLRFRVQLRDPLLDLSGRVDQHHDAADAARVDRRQRQERTIRRRPGQDRPAPAHREVITP